MTTVTPSTFKRAFVGDDALYASRVPANDLFHVSGSAGAILQVTSTATADYVWFASKGISVLDYIPVTEHAAILAGTSTYDCSTNIASAITAAVVAGKELRVPAGTYMFGARVAMLTNLQMRGEAGAIFKPTASNVSTTLLVYTNGQTNVTIRDITFDGNVSGISSTVPLMTLFNTSRVKIIGCRFQNTRGIAINLSTSIRRLKIIDCQFDSVGVPNGVAGSGRKQAIALTEAVLGASYDIQVKDCDFNIQGLDCISMSHADNVEVVNNTVRINGAGLIYNVPGYPSTNFRIIGNYVVCQTGNVSPYPNAIDLDEVSDFVVANNTLKSAGGCGIGLFPCARGVVTGNVITNSHQDAASVHNAGIFIGEGSDSILLDNNICTDTQGVKTAGYGLLLNATATNITVTPNNHFYGNATADVATFTGTTSLTIVNTFTAPRELQGFGTPEGVVTAAIGSKFIRLDGGASTVIYIKESGTGNTGWVAK